MFGGSSAPLKGEEGFGQPVEMLLQPLRHGDLFLKDLLADPLRLRIAEAARGSG
jgi:hypothetical protein